MSEPKLATRQETRRNREKRKDGTIELPFNERVEVECPVCGESFETNILTGAGDPSSWGYCVAPDCDAFLKFRRDASEEEASSRRESDQSGLEQFVNA